MRGRGGGVAVGGGAKLAGMVSQVWSVAAWRSVAGC